MDKPYFIFSLFSSGASQKTVINCFFLAYLPPLQKKNKMALCFVPLRTGFENHGETGINKEKEKYKKLYGITRIFSFCQID